MFEQKTTLNIVLTIDVIKAKILYAKTIEELNQAKKELEDFTNQVWFRKDEQVERVKKSVFIEHLTEEQQKELWEALYG